MVETAAVPTTQGGSPLAASPVQKGAGSIGGTSAGSENKIADVAAVPGAKPGESNEAAIKRILKAKIDGQEVEVSEEDAIRAYQKGKASDKRFQEASTMKKQSENFLRMLKESTTNPKVLEQLIHSPEIGGDFRKIAEQYLYDIIQRERMSPEQRELVETKEKLAAMEQRDAEAKRTETETQTKQLQEQYSKDYQADIITTLDKSGLPKSEYTIARMARYMYMGLQRGVELKAADVTEMVRRDYQKEISTLMGGLPADQLASIVGEDTLKKLRQFDLAKVKGGQKEPTLMEEGRRRTPKVPERLSKDDWRKSIHEKAGY